jgi:collagenase-like PrtC family protease
MNDLSAVTNRPIDFEERGMIRFTIGFQPRKGDEMTEAILRHRDRAAEVYFAWGDFSSGRGKLKTRDEQEVTERALERFHDSGIGLNLLLNAECFGGWSLARALYEKIGDTVDDLRTRFGLNAVTTASPVIAKFLKTNFAGIDVRASVNMGIGEPEAFDYLEKYFDAVCLKREYNLDLAKIRAARRWCDTHGKKLVMLANSGCLNECPVRHFHDSLVAHEEEIAGHDNAFGFGGICRDFLRGPEGPEKFFRHTNFVRPEDLHLYEGLFDMVKLATRTNPDPVRVIEAYLTGHYRGNLPGLLEPDHSGELYPIILENSLLPAEFGTARAARDWSRFCAVDLESMVTRGSWKRKPRKKNIEPQH